MTKDELKQLSAIERFIEQHPSHKEELFRRANVDPKDTPLLTKLDVVKLHQRLRYMTEQRAILVEAPRCFGKVCYSKKEATVQSKKIWDRGRGRMRVYQCDKCQQYHLTHLV